MASQKNFAITPSVSISRSKFRRPSQHKTSFNLGYIVPIYVDSDILPGDTVSMDLAALIRMSNPVAPIMDNIFVDYYAFFVPNRLLWTNWKKFMGENTNGSGAVTSEPQYPVVSINGSISGFGGSSISVGDLGDYLGLPVGLTGATAQSNLSVSALPGRAYCLIYNEWFRDQNLIAPVSVYLTDGLDALVNISGTNYSYNLPLFKAAKESDYFTRALPYAQKGNPVSLPLGSTADVLISNAGPGILTANTTINVDSSSAVSSGSLATAHWVSSNSSNNASGKLVADLSNATAATINQLRFAFQYQKFLEKDALYGTRLKFQCLVKIAEKIWKALLGLIRGEGYFASRNAYVL